MSYPDGFSRLCIGDGGTQRMARGEYNIRSHVDEGSSSTSYEDVPSRVDAARVIIWLKTIRKSWAYAFWKKFSFPSNVRVYFSSLRPRLTACTKEDKGGMNFIYWLEVHISEGLRFPLPPLVHQFSTIPTSILSTPT